MLDDLAVPRRRPCRTGRDLSNERQRSAASAARLRGHGDGGERSPPSPLESSNLGAKRTLAIPVAQAIYCEMGPERRTSMGIEDSQDLIKDFEQALAA